MTLKLNWTLIASIVSAAVGVVGTVLTPIYGSGLTTATQAVLQAVAALLLVIGGYHVTSVASSSALASLNAGERLRAVGTSVVVSWALIASVLSALAGVAGTVITPIYGSTLSGAVSGVLQALSGLLAAIGAYHVTKVATTQAKTNAQRRLESGLALGRQLKPEAPPT